MKLIRQLVPMAAVLLLAFSISLYAGHAVRASDHQDSPTVVANPLADITDVFAFPDPHDASKVALVMDIRPLIPSGMYGNIALDPNVLYQFKIANTNVTSSKFNENLVIQLKADSAGTGQNINVYGPAAPNEVGTTNTLVAKTGSFAFNKPSKVDGGKIQIFAGPRRDPFFFDLAQFFKIIPDRDYKLQPNPPPPSATSFRFATKSQKIVLNGVSYGTAGSNGCVIAQPRDFFKPYDLLSIVIEMPKTMLEAGSTPGLIGLWATTATANGKAQ